MPDALPHDQQQDQQQDPQQDQHGFLARRGGARLSSFLPLGPLLSFGVAIVAVVAIAVFSVRSLQERTAAAESVSHTLEVIEAIQGVVSSLKDAETGQRGYLLTGTEQYLTPYGNALGMLPGQLKDLRELVGDSERQLRRLGLLEQHSRDKAEELEQTIALRRSGDADAALRLMRSDRGRAAMESIRAVAAEMDAEERGLATQRRAAWERTAAASLAVTGGGSLLLLVLIVAAALLTSRNYRIRETEAWLRSGHAGLNEQLQGDRQLTSLADKALNYLARRLHAQVGALYMAEAGGSRFQRISGYALSGEAPVVQSGEGLLGQAAKDQRLLHVEQLPAGYLPVSSSLGAGAPCELLLMPVSVDGRVQCVIELGFLQPTRPEDRQLLVRVADALGLAVRAATDRTRLEALLEETRRQAEELQTQQEELQSSNEELEEQARQLEMQREDLSRAQVQLSEKAGQLTRTSQFKSEFLANMSHELRTPLNSTLILAKLLADNKAGNLSDEQVRFAQTISSAGNDLLLLINDILDISKIEAGKLDLSIEQVPMQRVADSVRAMFAPQAQQRGLGFEVTVAADAPAWLEVDEARLGQILKNLLSNALKFTEAGSVTLNISGSGPVSFSVRDSGIGIAEDQQEMIFEAFRQADGSTQRKYGGTGLGLSISRTLARMLGGDIALRSSIGQGSSFTLSLPTRQHAGALVPAAPAPALDLAHAVRAAAAVLAPSAMGDDRESLAPNARAILVIEDDPHFAGVLRDLVREMGFPCIVTHSAGDGLLAAGLYQPSAVLLDMKLPDMSGFGVLEQLKRAPSLRHIPVHVISVGDYSQEVLEMGAVGYALKPVKREELEVALRRLEAKFSQRLRRVLVVEDEPRQRDAIEQLLQGEGVEIVGVDTAAQALEKLRESSFDCMVMDLNLPDVSGYELLDRMAHEEALAFPPVIVYTGRSLSRDEEHELRRFSRSIIVKGARSPERLLDEVTLFLHQVEASLPPERQRMLKAVRERETLLDGRRVLIVEDDVRNIFALSAVLEPKGIKVLIARNGREAVDLLTRTPEAVDLVLMDIMMPEMDGITATREIRKLAALKKLPIIALTAKAMKDDHEKCLAAGASDYIAKPLDVEKLLSLMRVWMQQGSEPGTRRAGPTRVL